MQSLDFGRSLSEGLLISLVPALVILASLKINSRMWLHDLPVEVQAALPPLSNGEKQLRSFFGVLLLAGLFVPIIVSALRLRAENGGALPFGVIYLHVYVLFMAFNLFDLLIIDWLFLEFIRPAFAIPPGAEHLVGLHRGYKFHFLGFLKGTIIGLVFSAPIALLLTL
jgi:hypothetical protein